MYAPRFGESATTTESVVRLGTGVEEESSTYHDLDEIEAEAAEGAGGARDRSEEDPWAGMMRMKAKPMVVARLGAGVAGEDPGTVIIMIRMGMKPMVVRPMMVARLGAGVVEEEPRTGIIVMRI